MFQTSVPINHAVLIHPVLRCTSRGGHHAKSVNYCSRYHDNLSPRVKGNFLCYIHKFFKLKIQALSYVGSQLTKSDMPIGREMRRLLKEASPQSIALQAYIPTNHKQSILLFWYDYPHNSWHNAREKKYFYVTCILFLNSYILSEYSLVLFAC